MLQVSPGKIWKLQIRIDQGSNTFYRGRYTVGFNGENWK